MLERVNQVEIIFLIQFVAEAGHKLEFVAQKASKCNNMTVEYPIWQIGDA